MLVTPWAAEMSTTGVSGASNYAELFLSAHQDPAPWGQGLTVTKLGTGGREVGVLRLLPVVANSTCQLDGAQGCPDGW